MSKILKTHQKTIGNLAIALLFLGGCIFMFTSSWNAPETEAASSCGCSTVPEGACNAYGANNSNSCVGGCNGSIGNEASQCDGDCSSGSGNSSGNNN